MSFRLPAFGLVLALSAVLSPHAHADSGEAEASFASALAAYDRGEYEEALRAFERAYSLKPSYKLLYNIGLTQMARGDAAHALDAFEQYLREGGEEIPGPRKNELRETQATLNKKVGEIVIEGANTDESYTLDDERLASARVLSPLRVNAGNHALCRANATGSPSCRTVHVLAQQRSTLRLAALAPRLDAEAAPSSTRNDAPPEPQSDHTWRVVAWSGAGALAAGGVLTGVLALNARGNEKDAEHTRDITRAELDDAHSKTQRFALATDLLFAGAIACTGVALYLQLSSPDAENGASRTSAHVLFKPGGVDFSLHF